MNSKNYSAVIISSFATLASLVACGEDAVERPVAQAGQDERESVTPREVDDWTTFTLLVRYTWPDDVDSVNALGVFGTWDGLPTRTGRFWLQRGSSPIPESMSQERALQLGMLADAEGWTWRQLIPRESWFEELESQPSWHTRSPEDMMGARVLLRQASPALEARSRWALMDVGCHAGDCEVTLRFAAGAVTQGEQTCLQVEPCPNPFLEPGEMCDPGPGLPTMVDACRTWESNAAWPTIQLRVDLPTWFGQHVVRGAGDTAGTLQMPALHLDFTRTDVTWDWFTAEVPWQRREFTRDRR